MMSSHHSFLRLTGALLGFALALPASVAAGETEQRFGQIQVGPLIGGQELFYELRSSEPNAFTVLFLGVDGAPTPLGNLKPVLGMNLLGSALFIRQTDASGRDLIKVPTALGAYGPTCLGLPLFFQAIVKPSIGNKPLFATNVEAVEVEPVCAAVVPFLVDDSVNRLPVGYDTLGATWAQTIDVNKDGYPDLLLGADFDLRLWVNDGTGVFADETASRIAYDGQAVGALFVVDLDGNSWDDIVVAGGFDDNVSLPDRVWFSDGAGGFVLDTSGTFPDGTAGSTQSIVFADFDGDGVLDMVKGVGEEQHLASPGGLDELHRGQPGGTWIADTAFGSALWNLSSEITVNLTSGDIDNDGDLDLFVAKSFASNLLLRNDGVGGFTNIAASNLSPLYVDNSQDGSFVDLDLDGDLDLVVANSHFSVPANLSGDLYFNDGTGFFTEDATSDIDISAPADNVRLSVYTEDIDADGDPDVMMGVHDLFSGADQLLFLNQGGAQGGVAGDLLRQFWFDPGDHITYGIVAFDADHDGDNDVLQVASGVVMATPPGLQTIFFENTRL